MEDAEISVAARSSPQQEDQINLDEAIPGTSSGAEIFPFKITTIADVVEALKSDAGTGETFFFCL